MDEQPSRLDEEETAHPLGVYGGIEHAHPATDRLRLHQYRGGTLDVAPVQCDHAVDRQCPRQRRLGYSRIGDVP